MQLVLICLLTALFPVFAFAQTTIGSITYQDETGAGALEQNIRFSQLDSGAAIPSGLNYGSSSVLNAAGVQTAWQQMSNGDLMVRATGGVPASRFPSVIYKFDIIETANTGYTVSYGNFSSGTFLRGEGPSCSNIPQNTIVTFIPFSGFSIPSPFVSGTPYYVVGCAMNGGLSHFAISASYNGAPLTLSGGSANSYFAETMPFAVSGATFTSIAHGYPAGATLKFDMTDSGSLPSGINSGTVYFVCNPTTDTFQVSTSASCNNIVTTASRGTGVPEILATLTWKLQSGVATNAAAANPPVLSVVGNNFELTNGLTGVRIPTPAYEMTQSYSMAPIQGLRAADGTWTSPVGPIIFDTTPNRSGNSVGTGYTLSLAEKGMLETSLTASLAVNRALHYLATCSSLSVSGSTLTASHANCSATNGNYMGVPYSVYVVSSTIAGLNAGTVYYTTNVSGANFTFQVAATPGGPALTLGGGGTAQVQFIAQEPGPGYYKLTVTLDANTKAAIVLEDHNIHDYQYSLNWRPNLTADVTRFRGGGSTNAIGNGYFQMPAAGGGYTKSLYPPYPPGGGYVDEFLDLLGANRTSFTTSTANTIRFLGSQYFPNDYGQTGHYWMLYSSTGSPSSNATGLFTGRGSLQYYGEAGGHGPGVFDTPSTSAQGITFWDSEPASTLVYYTGEVKKSFGIWVSTKSDILTPTQVQTIDNVRGVLAGINVNRVKSYDLDFPAPVGAWTNLYGNTTQMNALTTLLNDGSSLCGFSNCLSQAIQGDGVQQPLAALLQDNTPPRISVSLAPLVTQLQSFANDFYNQMGNMDPTIAYYQGAYPCVRYSSMANLIMMSPAATPWQQRQAKHFLGFCAGFLWDPDFYSNDPSLSGGLGNQQSQFLQQKAQFATQLTSDPAMQPLVQQSVQNIQVNLLGAINQYGAGYGSWHYQGAATEQAIFGWLNLAATGQLNISNFPVVSKFGQWYMSGITPPEVRFGNLRMYISDGDGNTEPETDPGLLAALLYPGYPNIASQLMWVWYSQGMGPSTLSSFVAPSLLAMNFGIPPVDPQMTSQHFPGSHSMLRSGWDSGFENAADFLYGGFYSQQGHAHSDTGRVAAYLLGAPISIDWNPNLYYPEVAGRFQHSTVCLDSELTPVVWSQDSAPLNACNSQFSGASPDNTNLIQTSTFTGSSSATASWSKSSDGTAFNRTVTLLNYDPNYAILHTYDSFSGPQATGSKTLTWNLMADNSSVQTPAGAVVPAVRQNLNNNGVLPSTSPTYGLNGNGLQQFAFHGAAWQNHPTGGVDFDLYTQNADQQQFVIGNWCHNQYQNNCALESQDIVRLHGNGNFDTWIVARKKGSTDPAVSLQACGVQVMLTGTLCFDQTYSMYDNRAGTKTLATYDASSHSAFGMSISGGPAECVLTATQINCTIHGWQSSTRTIAVPAGYYPTQPTAYDMSGYVLAYSSNGQPLQLNFTTNSASQGHAFLSVPASGKQTLLAVTNPATGATESLASVPSGTMVLLHAPPNPYQVTWTSDSGQVQTLQVDVPYMASTNCSSSVEPCNPRLR